ncbi:sugar ABC transporter substrate-binding protein [Bifidobacterium tissieri]|uniref:Sugar ABC transporter substrate-binding protein n=2 Tax=Bifidobacterium TaxID=1678 RepID=A0A261F8U4_9BIFI|nr:substrate-binding domain-containing protein [Bifidobacterium tissieri]OZG55579.1 sugar ABC transporter substrate-binding protein [Bifidobacterium tissieri]TPF97671.1 hypothetical protein EP30_01645 [Bifidobacterium sp. UTCIF-39]
MVRWGRHAIAVAALMCMMLPLAGCMPQDKAVGDTQETEAAIAHDGIDRADATVGVVGSADPDNANLDSRIVEAIGNDRMPALYAAGNTDAGSQQRAVSDFLDRNVKAIVLHADQSTGWEEALTKARKAGIPVVLLASSIEPDDQTLYAARLVVVSHDAQTGGVNYAIGDALMRVIDDKPHTKTMNVLLTGVAE